jgi:hypothetical protein
MAFCLFYRRNTKYQMPISIRMEIIILEMLVLVIISNINNTMVVPFATDQDTFNIYMSDAKIVTGSIKP